MCHRHTFPRRQSRRKRKCRLVEAFSADSAPELGFGLVYEADVALEFY